ncbi:MAG: hypothetical protein ACRC0F_12350, partial [Cetobacterium sp.]
NYNSLIFDRYIEILFREKNRIEAEKTNLKTGVEIEYYSSTDESLNDLKRLESISRVEVPNFDKMFSTSDRDEYFDWIDGVDRGFTEYIDKTSEALFEYQSNKNRFLTKPRNKKIVEGTIEQEVNDKRLKLDDLRVELGVIEEKIEIDIKNRWREELNSDPEAHPTLLKSLLQKRPAPEDVRNILCLSLIQIFVYGYYKNVESIASIAINVLVMAVIITAIILILLFTLKSEINRVLSTAVRIRDRYSEEVTRKIAIKKQHIDKEIEVRIAEKNYQLAKRKEAFLNEQQELLEYYRNQIDSHTQNSKELKRIISNIDKGNVDEINYLNESFNVKLGEIDYKKVPFENDKFNPCKYIEIAQYKDLIVCMNQQENRMSPQNLFGCHSILLSEDKIYNEAVE